MFTLASCLHQLYVYPEIKEKEKLPCQAMERALPVQ
jgi:hypothetical protein